MQTMTITTSILMVITITTMIMILTNHHPDVKTFGESLAVNILVAKLQDGEAHRNALELLDALLGIFRGIFSHEIF